MSLLFKIFGLLPLPFLHRLGAVLGALLFALSRRERRRAAENIALAFPRGAPRGLALRSAMSSVCSFIELPYLWAHPIDQVLSRVEAIDGWQHVEAARQRGEAVIFLTPHLGSFEIAGQTCAGRLPIVALYRAPESDAFHRIMCEGRTRGGMTVAAADHVGVKKLLKSLRRGEAVGILPDQVPQHGEGIWAPHFGRPAYTMTLAARLSALPKVTTFFIYALRRPGGRFAVIVRPPAQALAGDVDQRVLAINREIEKIILECPEQYYWSYNRYKTPHEAAGEARHAAG